MNFNNIPTVTKYLLIINIIVFVFTGFIAPQLGDIFSLRYFQNPDFAPWQILTSMFTHAGSSHLFFNMFALFMFGSAIEKAFGPKKFLQLYFVAGLGAVLLHQGVQYFQIQSALGQLPQGTMDQLLEQGRNFQFGQNPAFYGKRKGCLRCHLWNPGSIWYVVPKHETDVNFSSGSHQG